MSQPSAGQWQSVTTDELEATIPVNDTVSNAVDLKGTFLCGLVFPSTFDGTQLRFQVSNDGTTFQNYYNTSGTLITMTCAASTTVGIVPSDFAMWRYIKLVSVTTQTTTSTVIGLVTRPIG